MAAIHNMYTDINGGTYIGPGDYRVAGTSYQGDRSIEDAKLAAKKKMTTALKWAKMTSRCREDLRHRP